MPRRRGSSAARVCRSIDAPSASQMKRRPVLRLGDAAQASLVRVRGQNGHSLGDCVLVGTAGLEPARPKPGDFKSPEFTNFSTSPRGRKAIFFRLRTTLSMSMPETVRGLRFRIAALNRHRRRDHGRGQAGCPAWRTPDRKFSTCRRKLSAWVDNSLAASSTSRAVWPAVVAAMLTWAMLAET